MFETIVVGKNIATETFSHLTLWNSSMSKDLTVECNKSYATTVSAFFMHSDQSYANTRIKSFIGYKTIRMLCNIVLVWLDTDAFFTVSLTHKHLVSVSFGCCFFHWIL